MSVSDVPVTTSIDLCVHRARFRCPGSPFRLFFEQPGQKHPRKIANSALPHNIRHHTSAEFRASGFAYIERSRDGLSRFPKRGQNHDRDNEIWPGSHVNRLPSPPGHRLRIDKMLQCLTGMRPYRDSNVSLEVEESSSTPPNRKHGGILQCSESPRPVLGVADHGFERRGCSWTAA